MDPVDEIQQQIQEAAARLNNKGLLGRPGDLLSMRIPGTPEMMWLPNVTDDVQISSTADAGNSQTFALHAAIYRQRPDAGAILNSTTDWSEQLAEIGKAPPVLFDEQARHIGSIASPVPSGEINGLLNAVRGGSNVALYGSQCFRIGMTKERVVFNAELFEKCATAFVIAGCTDRTLRTIPGWVRFIAGRRLRKDQRRAAESYRRGFIPQGMNAY